VCRERVRDFGCGDGGLPNAVAGEQVAEGGMQVAQPGLGRLPVVLVIVRRARLILQLVRDKMVVKVPDRVDERALLRGQQQEDACELEECALHATSPMTSSKVREKFKPFAAELQMTVQQGCCTGVLRAPFIR